jgi:hypothetical protein
LPQKSQSDSPIRGTLGALKASECAIQAFLMFSSICFGFRFRSSYMARSAHTEWQTGPLFNGIPRLESCDLDRRTAVAHFASGAKQDHCRRTSRCARSAPFSEKSEKNEGSPANFYTLQKKVLEGPEHYKIAGAERQAARRIECAGAGLRAARDAAVISWTAPTAIRSSLRSFASDENRTSKVFKLAPASPPVSEARSICRWHDPPVDIA